MAGFKTHISVSCVVGAGYGTAGFYAGLPPESCMVAAGICGIAGILPDLDSKTGVPRRETLALAAAIIPALMLDRFKTLGFSHERIALLCGLVYIFVRFGIGQIFKRFSVHRGMWHSIPAAAAVGCCAYLLCSGIDEQVRYFKAIAAVLGFLTHLVLDEIWSLNFGATGVRVKKSFGTALKFSSHNTWANIGVYAKLAVLAMLAFGDPSPLPTVDETQFDVPQVARPLSDIEPTEDATQWR